MIADPFAEPAVNATASCCEPVTEAAPIVGALGTSAALITLVEVDATDVPAAFVLRTVQV